MNVGAAVEEVAVDVAALVSLGMLGFGLLYLSYVAVLRSASFNDW